MATVKEEGAEVHTARALKVERNAPVRSRVKLTISNSQVPRLRILGESPRFLRSTWNT